ncbi:MAG: DUF3105 domain-containing protein [Anaerolineae bacterium]|nr:DUF3105 domain-containing protein [Anaerolineae bacterium]
MSKALMEKRRAAVAKQKRRRYLIYGGALALVLVIAVAAVTQTGGRSRFSSTGPIEGLQTFAGLSRAHAVDIDLADAGRPPAGGPHHPQWLNCGIYREPVPTINAIHSLEHGAVWVTYDPSLPADQVAQLESLTRGDPYVLVSPYPGQESPIIATAWGAQVDVDDANDERIEQFVLRYRTGGPEPGAVCAGGLGEPVS